MFLIAITAFVLCSAAVGAAPSTGWLIGAARSQPGLPVTPFAVGPRCRP